MPATHQRETQMAQIDFNNVDHFEDKHKMRSAILWQMANDKKPNMEHLWHCHERMAAKLVETRQKGGFNISKEGKALVCTYCRVIMLGLEPAHNSICMSWFHFNLYSMGA
jgi:predicted alpha/beta hydrolase family esterase